MTAPVMRGIACEEKVPMRERTTLRVGGPADLVVYPGNIRELVEVMREGGVSLVLGGGSNLLVSDEGVRGTALSLGQAFRAAEIKRRGEDVLIEAGAGVLLAKLSGMAMKASAAGLEFAYGIPGTLGGALVMNAGAGGGRMKDVVETVDVVTREGEAVRLRGEEAGFGYRSSSFPEGCVITSAVIRLREGDARKINEKMRRLQLERKASQPLSMPSAGSVFKNPPGDFAGRLIEAAGLKGAREGGAMVSEKHANFIVNTGSASAADVHGLMIRVEREVYGKFGVRLEREIRLVGRFE